MAYQFLIKNMKHVLEMVDFMGERVLLHTSFGMCFSFNKKEKVGLIIRAKSGLYGFKIV